MEDKKYYQKIFVGHATPEDNYFSAWLSAKLRLLGYDVWCDLSELLGGEDFWKNIEAVIRQESIKFLFVLSESSIAKKGVLQELALADRIKDRADFIIPLRISDIPGDALPTEIIRINYINFHNNWASGLRQLLDKLQKDGVPSVNQNPDTQQIIGFWNEKLSSEQNLIVQKDEVYRSNWFEVSMPTELFLYNPKKSVLSTTVPIPFPFIEEENYVLTFACKDCFSKYLEIKDYRVINLEELLKERIFPISEYSINIIDGNRKVVQLINQALSQHLVNKGLLIYPLSASNAYYFPLNFKPIKVDIKRYGRRSIQLAGKYNENNWHFGIEGNAFLYPIKGISISSHVVFTKNGDLIPQIQQHKSRRSIGKDWYNKKWRDLLLGALLAVSSDNSSKFVNLPICDHSTIQLQVEPISFTSPFGYLEPLKSK